MDYQLTCQECGNDFEARTKEARYCPKCVGKKRGNRRKYIWTEQRQAYLRQHYDSGVRGRAQEIAKHFGFPDWEVKKQAGRMGLAKPVGERRDWTRKEKNFLKKWAGKRTTLWIARKLNRSETAVVLKLKREKISRKLCDGYTLRQLELALGVDHRVIQRWVTEGKLQVEKYGTHRVGVQGDIWRVSEEAVLDFFQAYPMEFRLDRVDQEWFMTLVFDLNRPKARQIGKCSVCDKKIHRRAHKERRPTGSGGEMETWWYCERCSEELHKPIFLDKRAGSINPGQSGYDIAI